MKIVILITHNFILHSLGILAIILFVAQCSIQENVTNPGEQESQSITAVGYTYQQSDGNRIVSGTGGMLSTQVVDIPLSGTPEWIVAAPLDTGSAWLTVLRNGAVRAYKVMRLEVASIQIMQNSIPPGTPPMLVVYQDGTIEIGNVIESGASALTSPVLLNSDDNRIAWITISGELVIQETGKEQRLSVNALPDTRLLADEQERVLVLTDPTDRYAHGVLGDAFEAASVTLVETQPELKVVLKIEIPEPAVIEGTSAIWTDINSDGTREIIVTVSDASQGARLVVFNEGGLQIAASAAIGRGFRWQHQIAVARIGDAAVRELVTVKTPHIGGVVEFFRLVGDTLLISSAREGCTSHVIYSRNLDMAMVGDFDGNGQAELLLPNQAMTELCAVQRAGSKTQIEWTVPLDGSLTSNLAGVTRSDGSMIVGAGTDQNVLRLWLP